MKLYVDRDSYGGNPSSVLVEAVNSSVRDIVRRHLSQSGIEWSSFVSGTGRSPALSHEIAGIEERILATGYRFLSASFASARDRPDAYRDSTGAPTISIEHADADTGPLDIDGREQRGSGDNVVRHHFNVVGTARYIRTSEQVIEYLRVGVPSDTIAIVEDSGCTLTAPILQNFKGVICAGGTVRSHLGILTREYGVPCLMNARISGIQEGDRIELETSAQAKTAAAYQDGQDCSARIWRLDRCMP